MKLLVTGATGFIGKNLCQRLMQNNIKFSCIIRENSDKFFFQEYLIEYFIFNNNIDSLVEYMKINKFDGLVHLASSVIVEHKKENVDDLIFSNILFGTKLLEASGKTNLKWFLNTGTFWQHYQGEQYNPVNLYAATKQAFEDIARYYVEVNDIVFTTIKLNDTYGEGDTRQKIFSIWEKIAKSGEILDMSAGEQVIDIVHISKVVDKYIKLIHLLNNENRKKYNLKSYCVTSGRKISLKNLAKEYERNNSVKLNINWGARHYRDREVMNPVCNGKVL